jgi:cyclopropane-fatty-acyl-phospholipid synthase
MDAPVVTPSSAAQRANPALLARLRAPASAKAVFFGFMNIKGGALRAILPDGHALEFGDGAGPTVILQIRDYRFARRVLFSGDIGFAEGLMAGEWESPDLSALLTLLAGNIEPIARLLTGGPVGQAFNLLRHLTRQNTRRGSRRNILAHYDLGNRFYGAWLDRTMTYSAARFDTPSRDLETAQLEKYRSLARHLDLKPGEHVLEIGCGWGGFAEVAAKEFGARVTGLTISDEQFAFARARMEAAGLTGLVEIRHQDYRDVEGPFDKVASIEMFEAVGEKYWPAYFSKIASVLKPGGRAALQIITIRDELFESYRKRADFIQRYVFPGGMLASLERLKSETLAAGLVWRKVDAFGQSYADTLAQWGDRFAGKWDEIRALGFDERFRQLWRFYLSYCEAGFRTGRTDVVQLELARP